MTNDVFLFRYSSMIMTLVFLLLFCMNPSNSLSGIVVKAKDAYEFGADSDEPSEEKVFRTKLKALYNIREFSRKYEEIQKSDLPEETKKELLGIVEELAVRLLINKEDEKSRLEIIKDDDKNEGTIIVEKTISDQAITEFMDVMERLVTRFRNENSAVEFLENMSGEQVLIHTKRKFSIAVEKEMSVVISEEKFSAIIRSKEWPPIEVDLEAVMNSALINDPQLVGLSNKVNSLPSKGTDIDDNNGSESGGENPLALAKQYLDVSDDIWGFKSGEYKIIRNNRKIEYGIASFIKVVKERLDKYKDKVEKEEIKLEILSVGYADNSPIETIGYEGRKNAMFFEFGGCPSHIDDDDSEKADSFYDQPFFLVDGNSVFVPCGDIAKGMKPKPIGPGIDNNCELSYARGYEAVQFLKKNFEATNKETMGFFDFSYAGRGVFSKSKNNPKGRKIIFYVRQSIKP